MEPKRYSIKRLLAGLALTAFATFPYFPIVIHADLELIRKGKAQEIALKSGDTVEVFREKGGMGGVLVDW